MKYFILLDAGHGLNTPGKRTPSFEDDSFMKEREFNQDVVKKMLIKLKAYDCEVVWVSEETEDVPLSTRTTRANTHYQNCIKKYGKAAVKSIFVSVHANAMGEKWANANGIETFAYPGNEEALKLADLVQKQLIRHTNLRDRGVKTANFAVLRQTVMPAILCECGFMDYKPEATLLRTDSYRDLCATAIIKGIVQYLNLPLKPIPVSPSAPSTSSSTKINIELNGHIKAVEVIQKDGVNYVRLRDLADDKILVDYKGMPIIKVK